MRSRSLAASLLGILALAARPAAAQVPGGEDSLSRAVAAALIRLTPGREVRVRLRSDGRREGPLAATSPTTLNLGTSTDDLTVPISDVDSLWVRGHATKTGAIVGTIPGVIAGSLLGVLVNAVACEDDGGDPCPQAIVIFGLAGGAAGGILGALIGSAFPQWHRRAP